MKLKIIVGICFMFLFAEILNSQSPIFLNAKKNFDEGKLDESKKMFNLIGKNSMEFAESRFYLGKIYYSEKNLDEAIRLFEEAIKSNNKNVEYYYMLGNMQGEKAMRSNIVQQAILAKNMLKNWQTGEKLDSMHLGIQWDLLNFYMRAPSIAGGGFDKAHKSADKLNKIRYPDGFEAHGYVYETEKKYDLAEKSFKEAIKANSKEPKYTYALAYFYMRHNGNDKALELWIKLSETHPEDSRAYLELGNIYSSNPKMLEKAKENLDHFLQIVDKNDNNNKSRANFYLGNISYSKGEKVNAKKYFETALSLNPDNMEAKKAIENFQK